MTNVNGKSDIIPTESETTRTVGNFSHGGRGGRGSIARNVGLLSPSPSSHVPGGEGSKDRDVNRLRDHFDRLFDTPTTIPQLRQAESRQSSDDRLTKTNSSGLIYAPTDPVVLEQPPNAAFPETDCFYHHECLGVLRTKTQELWMTNNEKLENASGSQTSPKKEDHRGVMPLIIFPFASK